MIFSSENHEKINNNEVVMQSKPYHNLLWHYEVHKLHKT